MALTLRPRAALEKAGFLIGPYDILLAGQAMAAGLILVTANEAEFARLPGLVIENWRRLTPPSAS